MRRLLLALVVGLGAGLALASAASAQPKPEFQLGFKLLALQIPDIVGDPVEDEHYGANGDSLQRTTKGLMAWRKSDNWTAFTNGARTWINGPYGIAERSNEERFPWESDRPPGTGLDQPPPLRKSVPLGESKTVATGDKQVEVTVVRVLRNADDRLRQLATSTSSRPQEWSYEESVLILLRLTYVEGPPEATYATDRVRDFGFLQINGASADTYLGTLPDPAVDRGLLSVGESKEGWIAAIVERDKNFVLLFGRDPNQRVPFALK